MTENFGNRMLWQNESKWEQRFVLKHVYTFCKQVLKPYTNRTHAVDSFI